MRLDRRRAAGDDLASQNKWKVIETELSSEKARFNDFYCVALFVFGVFGLFTQWLARFRK